MQGELSNPMQQRSVAFSVLAGALVAVASLCGGAVAGTVAYEYDALGRLKSATNANDGSKSSYDYDKAGNRKSDSYTSAAIIKPTLSAVKFGDRPKNVAVSLDATLTNGGSANIALMLPPTVTGAAYRYKSTTCAATLIKGTSCAFTVEYTPPGLGLHVGQLAVTAAGEALSAGLTGAGVEPLVAVVLDHVNPSPSGTVIPAYSGSTLAVYYRNNSSAPVALDSASATGASVHFNSDGSNGSCAPGLALAADAKCWLLVNYSVTTGAQSTTLTANFAGVPAIQTALSAVQKTLGMSVAGNGATTAGTADMTITLSNNTGGGFKFGSPRWSQSPSGAGGWTVQTDSCPAVLANGSSCTATVRYTAAGAGTGNLTLSPYGTFEWNDLLDGRVVAGSGLYRSGPVNVASLGLNATSQVAVVLDHVNPSASGTVIPAYSASTLAVYYRNNSNAPVALNSTSASGATVHFNSDGSNGSCAPGLTLAAGAKCWLLVNYSVATGAQNALLTTSFAGVPAIQTSVSAIQKTLDMSVSGNGATTAGTADMTVTLSNNTGGGFKFDSTRWSLGPGGTGSWKMQTDSCPAVLTNGSSCTVVVRYTAAGAGTGNLTLSPYGTFEWNDLLDGRVVAGSGLYRFGPVSVASLGLNATGQAAVVLDHVNPAAGGTVIPAYSASTLAVYYRNNSNAPVALNSASASGATVHFNSDGSNGSCATGLALAAGAKCWLLMNFGTTTGTQSTLMTANFSGVPAIQVSLSAAQKTLDMSVSGNGATTASTADMTVTLSNSTGGGFKFDSARWSLGSSGMGNWKVQADSCPAMLANGSSCTVVVRYTAAGVGTGNLTLSPYGTFEWNDLLDGRVVAGSGLYRFGPVNVTSLGLTATGSR